MSCVWTVVLRSFSCISHNESRRQTPRFPIKPYRVSDAVSASTIELSRAVSHRLWHRHRPYGHSRDCAKEAKTPPGGRGGVSHSRWILRTAARSVIRLTRYGTSRGDPPRFPGAGGGAWDNATACAACGSGFCGLNMVTSPTGRQDTTSLLAVCGNVLAASDTVRRRRRWWCDRSSYKRSLFSRIRLLPGQPMGS